MNRMRVLFPYVGDGFGGSHISSLELAKLVRSDSVNPIIGIHQTGPILELLESMQLSHVPLPLAIRTDPLKSWSHMRSVLATNVLATYLRTHHIHVVHTNDNRMHWVWGRAARQSNVAWLLNVRSTWKEHSPHYQKIEHLTQGCERVQVVANSKYVRQTLPHSMETGSHVVPPPLGRVTLDLASDSSTRSEARQAILAKLNASKDTRIILFVAQFTPRKRPLYFLRIANAMLQLTKQRLAFVMIGNMRSMAGVVQETIDDYGLQSIVYALGESLHARSWIAGADLLIAPAVDEPYGRTIREGMALGTPVVASNDGGNPEIVESGRSGLLCSPNNLGCFVRAALNLLEDARLYERIAVGGRMRIASLPPDGVVAEQFARFYDHSRL